MGFSRQKQLTAIKGEIPQMVSVFIRFYYRKFGLRWGVLTRGGALISFFTNRGQIPVWLFFCNN